MRQMKRTSSETKTQEPSTPAPEAEPVVPAQLSPAQIDDLRERAEKADENWDRYVRAVADLENYKKRATRERQEGIKFANVALLQELIPVLDTFDMALAASKNSAGNSNDPLQAGITMIHQQLKKALVDAGLEEVDALGKPFDPNLHEAVSQQETNDAPEGQVVQQLRKGYKLRERLIRPAAVVVAKKTDEQPR
jgi:molecular chaperone GrpE